MHQQSNTTAQLVAASCLSMQRIGTLGAVLAFAILGASMLLRLASVFATDGHSLSTLPVTLEHATRLLHRLCASGVAMLALGAVILCRRQRHLISGLVWPVVWIVGATVILALIGPFTPGYRLAAITVTNVSVGIVLLMAFWWLREAAAMQTVVHLPVSGLSSAAMVALLAHISTGAAASAWEMHGVRWPAFIHLGSLVLCIILTGAMLHAYYRQRPLDRLFAVWASLLALQMLLGYVLMWQERHSIYLSLLHGMLSPLMALALVSLVLCTSTPSAE